MQDKIFPPAVKIRHSQESWKYFYMVLAFAISIEGVVIAILPMPVLVKLVTLAIVWGVTVNFVIFNGWLQRKLLRWKSLYENSWH